MDASWSEIEAAFHEGASLGEAERSGWLAALAARSPALHREVAQLLEHDLDADERLRTAVAAGATRLVHDAGRSLIGTRLGAYRLTALIGEGGMSTVYRARRDDEAYRGEAAVKLLRHGLGSADAMARFRDERQILAALDHPGIVRLLDGGSTEGGTPYLIIELVEGVPITRHAEARRLGTRARVELLLTICDAVAYAHQRLVVHRDLKPSNILVGERGVPKLLDFGIAKLLDRSPVPGDRADTRTGLMLFTPEYASPEQARGEAVSTATDVYSLGAVLYELLAGQPPHPRTESVFEAVRMITEVDPPPPSQVAPPVLAREIAGDLDNVVRKAMSKEIARRYGSVEQLADDLRRYLEGRPVLARPATLGYRAGKLLHRHGGKLALAAAVACALVTATAWSILAARRADRASALATRRFAEGRRLAQALLQDIEERVRVLKGSTAAQELIVRSAAGYLDGLAAEVAGDPSLSRELAYAYVRLAEIQGDTYSPNLGRPADALASLGKAGAILDGMLDERDSLATRRARAMYLLGSGLITHALGELTKATELLQRGLAITGDLPEREQPRVHVLRAITALAFIHTDVDAQRKEADRGRAVVSRWLAAEPGSADARYWRALFLELDAQLSASSADPEAAVRGVREAVGVFERLAREHPDDARYARDHAVALTNLSMFLSGTGGALMWQPNVGDLDGAIVATRDSLPVLEALLARDPEDMRGRVDLGGVLATYAALLAARDSPDALVWFERALATFTALPGEARQVFYSRQMEWFVRCAMSASLARAGRGRDAEAHARAGLVLAASVPADEKGGSPSMMCRHLVADARLRLGDRAGARSLLDENAEQLGKALARPAPALMNLIAFVDTERALARAEAEAACEHHRKAATAWRTWRPRTPFLEQRQAELDRRAGCER